MCSSDLIVAQPAFLILDGPAGKFSLSLTSAGTNGIPTAGKNHREVSRYYIEVKLDEDRILNGVVEVSPTLVRE